MSSIGFISDLHLMEEQPERIALFLRFIEEYTPRLEQLYILGDLFEMWLGDDLISPAYQSVIDALKQASNTLPINIILGNRDFLMGEHFEKLSGCTILQEPFAISLEGSSALLMHGDLLCTDDQDYLQMRKLVRTPEWIATFLNKPAQERIDTARAYRQKSQKAVQGKESTIMDANNDAIRKYMERYRARILIHGHTHRTATHNHTLASGQVAQRYVLDEWHDDYGQILISDSRGLHFETIH